MAKYNQTIEKFANECADGWLLQEFDRSDAADADNAGSGGSGVDNDMSDVVPLDADASANIVAGNIDLNGNPDDPSDVDPSRGIAWNTRSTFRDALRAQQLLQEHAEDDADSEDWPAIDIALLVSLADPGEVHASHTDGHLPARVRSSSKFTGSGRGSSLFSGLGMTT